MTNLASPLGGQNIARRLAPGVQDASDRLLAGLAALVFPFSLSSWLLQMQVTPEPVEERVRLTLVTTAAPSAPHARQPVPSVAPDVVQIGAGNRPVVTDPALAVPEVSRSTSPSIEPDPLKLGVPEMSLPPVTSTTQRNIAGPKQTSDLGATARVRLSLGDSSFFGRLVEAQRSGECADLVNRLRSSQGGPSIDVILESLKRRGCSL